MPYIKYDDIEITTIAPTSMPADLRPYGSIILSKIRKQAEVPLGKWFECSGNYGEAPFTDEVLYMAVIGNDPIEKFPAEGQAISAAKGAYLYVGAPNPPFGLGGGISLPKYALGKVNSFIEDKTSLASNPSLVELRDFLSVMEEKESYCSFVDSLTRIKEYLAELRSKETLHENGNQEYVDELLDFLEHLIGNLRNSFQGVTKGNENQKIEDTYKDLGIEDMYNLFQDVNASQRSQNKEDQTVLIVYSYDFYDTEFVKLTNKIASVLLHLDAVTGDDDEFFDKIDIVNSQDYNLFLRNYEKKYDCVFFLGHSTDKTKQSFIYRNGLSKDGFFYLTSSKLEESFSDKSSLFLFSCSVDPYRGLREKFANVIIANENYTNFDIFEKFIYGFIGGLWKTQDVGKAIECGKAATFLEDLNKKAFEDVNA